jgi:hypothetical protein
MSCPACAQLGGILGSAMRSVIFLGNRLGNAPTGRNLMPVSNGPLPYFRRTLAAVGGAPGPWAPAGRESPGVGRVLPDHL